MTLVLLGLILVAAGIGIVTDDCVVACGSDGDKAFRAGCGYVAICCGVAAIGAALISPRLSWRAGAVGCVLVGAAACLAALVEGLSHLR